MNNNYNYTISSDYDILSSNNNFEIISSYNYAGDTYYIVMTKERLFDEKSTKCKYEPTFYLARMVDIMNECRGFRILKVRGSKTLTNLSEALTISDKDMDHLIRKYMTLKADKQRFTRDGFIDTKTNSFVYFTHTDNPTNRKKMANRANKLMKFFESQDKKNDDLPDNE